MATIVRIKRRRNEDPIESLVVSCKKKKQDDYPIVCSEPSIPQSSLKFAGTVSSKVEGVSKQIRDAIRKEKLQKEYKQHSTVDITSKNRQRQKKIAQTNRLKIISSNRHIELEQLDKSETKVCNDTDTVKTACNTNGNVGDPTLHRDCSQKKESNPPTKNSSNNSPDTSNDGASVKEKVYQLLDVEIDNSKPLPTYESLLKESQSANNITCNSVPLVKEKADQGHEDDFVYDLYYTNNQNFNFQALVSDLTVQTYDDEIIFADDRNFTNEEIYDDEDDSNDEDNWRNDYPDEDPQFYENEDAESYYYDDRAEAAFDGGQNIDPEMIEWMSSRCNIEAGEASGDEEQGSSYDRYYRTINSEMAD